MRAWFWCSLLSLVLLGTLVPACGDRDGGSGKGKESSPPAPPPVAAGLFIVGNDRGRIRPCGCSKPLLGGIERRLALFGALTPEAAEASLVLAFGDLVEASGRQQELKVESFLESLTAIKARVFCPADGDLLLGTTFWRESRQLASFPFVAGNLTKDDRPLFEPAVALDWGERRVVVTSWLSPRSSLVTEPGVAVVADPDLAPLRDLLEEGPGRAELVIYGNGERAEIEAWIDRSGLRAAAASVLVVLRGVSDIPDLLHAEAGYAVLEMGKKGRDVARLDWPGEVRLERFTLDSARGRDPLAIQLLDFYRDQVREEDLLGKAPMRGEVEGRYVGAETCMTCHVAAHQVWKGSGHARAWATLVESGDAADPECVACHVVGFGLEGGFDPAVPAPVDVQCESCHGPGAEHAAGGAVPTPAGKLGERDCFGCHDLENSPAFRFEDYWPRIAHGK